MNISNLSYVPRFAKGLLKHSLELSLDDLCLLLDPEKPAWAVVNPTGMSIIELCDGKCDIRTIAALLAQKYQIPEGRACQDVLGYIDDLARAGLLQPDEEDTGQQQMPAPEFSVRGIYLHVTDRCNLRCKHCYAAGTKIGEQLSFEEICRLIDQMVGTDGHCKTGWQPALQLAISGGEPLLRRDIDQILTYASGKLETVLLTNGILIDEAMARFLSHLDVYLQISLDGMSSSIHDGIRGAGAFQRTMKAIELLLARNMREKLVLSVSVMKSNLEEVPKLIEFALQAGIPQVNMRPVVAQGNASLNWEHINPTPDEYAQLFHELYPLFFEHRRELLIQGCLADFIFGTLSDPRKRGCPAGEKLMVDSNGDVYPCPMLSHPDYCLGNVRDKNLNEIQGRFRLNQMCQQFADRVKNIAKCQRCHWRGFCRGACPGAALWQKGTIWDVDDLCDVRADFYRKTIFRYAKNL